MGRSPAGVMGQAAVGATLGGETDVGKAALKRRKSVAKKSWGTATIFCRSHPYELLKSSASRNAAFRNWPFGMFFLRCKDDSSLQLYWEKTCRIGFAAIKMQSRQTQKTKLAPRLKTLLAKSYLLISTPPATVSVSVTLPPSMASGSASATGAAAARMANTLG